GIIPRARRVSRSRPAMLDPLAALIPDEQAARLRPLLEAARGADVEQFGHLYERLREQDARRASGAFYTPASLTEPLVSHALEPLVYDGPRQGLPRRRWRLRGADEILSLRVCDPAAGAGAFLVRACHYLAERLLEAWGEGDAATARGLVVRHCL